MASAAVQDTFWVPGNARIVGEESTTKIKKKGPLWKRQMKFNKSWARCSGRGDRSRSISNMRGEGKSVTKRCKDAAKVPSPVTQIGNDGHEMSGGVLKRDGSYVKMGLRKRGR